MERSGRVVCALLGALLLATACAGERPELLPEARSARPLDLVDPGVERDPTGLRGGQTELGIPELLALATTRSTVDGETVAEAGYGPLPAASRSDDEPDDPAAESDESDDAGNAAEAENDESDDAADADAGGTGDPAGTEPSGPPTTLGFVSADLDHEPGYDDPWPSLLAATGDEVEAADGATTRGLSGSTLRVGGVVAETLVDRPHLHGVCEGAAARFARANAERALFHQIEVVDCLDDATQPDLNAGLVRNLVHDEDVFAVVPFVSPAALDASVLQDEHVPYAGWGASPVFCGQDVPYSVSVIGAAGCPVLDARGYATLTVPVLTALQSATPTARGTIVRVVEEGPAGSQVAASRTLEAGLSSLDLVTAAVVPPPSRGAPSSWTAIAADVLAADPDLVVLEARAVDGLPVALRTAGFRGEIAIVGHVDPWSLAKGGTAVGLDGVLVVSPGVDLAARSGSAWQRLVADAAIVDVDPDDIGLGFLQGYLSADVFVRAVAATPLPLTTERVHRTLASGWWYPGFGDIACGGWWPAGRLIDHPCVSVSRVDADTASLVPLVGLRETRPQLDFSLD